MAVPFCVPNKSKIENFAAGGTQATTHLPNSSSSPTTAAVQNAQQMIAWQMLAYAMCQALRDYYLQTASTKDGFISGSVQVMSNGKVKPIWK